MKGLNLKENFKGHLIHKYEQKERYKNMKNIKKTNFFNRFMTIMNK